MLKKILVIFLVLILCAPLCSYAAAKKKVGYVNLTYETDDNFVIKSKLYYPKQKAKVYPLVVFLHSIGYSSDYWGDLVQNFVNSGIAALVIDLRGHGQSVYDSDFRIRSWRYYSEKQFSVYPKDITDILKYLASNYKDISTTKYAIVGADIGANSAVLVSEKMLNKPKALVLMSPTSKFKGLYIPISMTNLGNIPIMTIASAKDNYSKKEADTLKKFAQDEYNLKIYPQGGMGMLMLKANPSMSKDIVDWVIPKLK